MALACVFPGQGSQAKGMGAELFDRFPDLVAEADAILGYSLRTLCVDDPHEQLGQTRFTQPALFAVNALSYLARTADGAAAPDYVAGHSLGEYDALFAAGAFDFATGVRLVQRRGEIMSEVSGGAMAAVIGAEDEQITRILADAGLTGIDVANYNSQGQTVISGPEADMAAAIAAFTAAGVRRVMRLNVSGAFHSRYMRDAADRFGECLAAVAWRPLALPVIANCTARPYADGEIAALLRRQICESVRWVETIQYLRQQAPDIAFEEVGPGKVLTGLIRRIN